MRYLLLFLAAPGSFALIAFLLRAAVRKVQGWRQDEEDAARAIRIQHEYGVTADAVEEPRGRRAPRRDHPEIASRYTREFGR